MISKQKALYMATITGLICLLPLTILWSTSGITQEKQAATIKKQRKELDALEKGIEQANRERRAYSSAIGILDIESTWYKERYFKACIELEEERAIVKDTKATLEKMKAWTKEAEELVNNAKGEESKQQSSRGMERRDAQLGDDGSGRTYLGEFRASAYCPCSKCNGGYTGTAMGGTVKHGVVAVDPRVISLGTKLYIEGYGAAVAGDTGGAIKNFRLDCAFNTHQEALNYGVRTVKVYRLN